VFVFLVSPDVPGLKTSYQIRKRKANGWRTHRRIRRRRRSQAQAHRHTQAQAQAHNRRSFVISYFLFVIEYLLFVICYLIFKQRNPAQGGVVN
jgi:hypothetical protein